MNVKSNRSEILSGLQIYHDAGDTFEIRIPDAGSARTISGYFTDFAKAAEEIEHYTRGGAAIYVTINPVDPRLIGRSNNCLKARAKNTTADKDITRLNWLPVDGDPPRPAGISATDIEHRASISKIENIRNWLITTTGWPENAFVIVDSGNGGYLLCRIELENSKENSNLVKKCLEALDYLFTDDTFHVDTTSSNPARILRVPGTTNAKGDEVGEMKHRLAGVLKVPEKYEVVSRRLLEVLAAMLPVQEILPRNHVDVTNAGFDPVAYCEAHDLQVHHTKSYNDGTLAVLEECIFDPNHKLSACIIGWPNGARTYRCRHSSCLDKHWKDAKAVIEPDNVSGILSDASPTPLAINQPSALAGARVVGIDISITSLEGCPDLEALTKATGRIDRVNPVTGEKEPDPITGENKIPKLTLSPSKAAPAIARFLPLRIASDDKNEKRKLWKFDGKIWSPGGEDQIKNLVDAIIGDLSYERGLQETLRRIRAITSVADFDNNPCLFPARDVVVDLRTGQARDYNPEDYITYQCGAAFHNPAADYKPFLWLLCSTLPDPRDVLTALDIATAACIRLPFEAIIQLIGPGGGGKGTYEKAMLALCTPARVTAITLVEAKGSRFGPGAVIGKDLWILSEVEDVRFAISLLKKVATGDLTDSDVKYGDRVQGKPHVLPILDCNNAIDFGDDSWGRKRRIIKLDYPYIFDYTPGTRLKDPHLEELVTSPAALSGLLQIIAARAPALCKSRRIYTRKRPEEMDAEYKRQQYSLHYFCEECLTISMPATEDGQAIDVSTGMLYPKGEIPKLKIDVALTEYKEYCRLFNVPVTAEKGQVGKYLHEKYGVSSVPTRDKNEQYRYYPGLWLSKSAKLAYAELSLSYSNYNSATDKLQKTEGKTTIYSLLATAATGEWPKEVIEEIERMFHYIERCENPQVISYRDYLENAVAAVAAVAGNHPTTIPDKSPIVAPKPSCSCNGEDDPAWQTIKADLLQAEERLKGKEEHFKDVADKYTKKPVVTTCQHATIVEPNEEIKHSHGNSHPDKGATCPVCGEDIGLGHSNHTFEGSHYCVNCAAPLAMIRASTKALTLRNGMAPTTSEIDQDVASRGSRPPLKKHLPAMLQCLGFIKVGDRWVESSESKQPDSLEIKLESTL